MSKVALEEVEAKLLENKVEPAKVQKIISDLNEVIEELKAERVGGTKQKWEHVVIIHEPSGKLIAEKMDEVMSAFVVQIEEGESPAQVFTKLREAASEQNEQAKRKKSRLDTLRDIFSGLKPKFLKSKKMKIKTKEAVRVLLTTGQMP